jgi:hypothetical protein
MQDSTGSELNLKLPIMSDAEFALLRAKEGIEILNYNQVNWQIVSRGLVRPTNLLQKITKSQLQSLPLKYWGAHGRVIEEDLHLANGTLDLHLMTDFDEFSLANMKKTDRQKIKKAQKFATIRHITRHDDFIKCYPTYVSAMQRTGQNYLKDQDTFARKTARYFAHPNRAMILGAFERTTDTICGYIMAYGVDTYGYIDSVYVNSQVMDYDINRLLVFEVINTCKRAEKIKEITMGQYFMERAGIVEFKRRIGFPVVKLPSVVRLYKVPEFFLKNFYSYKYKRIIGS